MTSDPTLPGLDARRIAALVTVVLLGVGVGACGGASGDSAGGHSSASAATGGGSQHNIAPGGTVPGRPVGDVHDGDDTYQEKSVHEQHDDISVVNFGHLASAQETAAIASSLRRYYKAAAADDGAAACKLLVLALVTGIPGEYLKGVKSSDPQAMCAFGVSKLLALHHKLLVTKDAELKVVGARVQGPKGYALLTFKSIGEPRAFAVEREGTTWKMEEFLDSEYP